MSTDQSQSVELVDGIRVTITNKNRITKEDGGGVELSRGSADCQMEGMLCCLPQTPR